MSFPGLFNKPPLGGSQRGNGNNRAIFSPQICSGVSSAQVTELSNVTQPHGFHSGVGHDRLSGARKRPKDLSFGQMSNYGGLKTSSFVGDKITMMCRQQQIEIGRLIEENERKLRLELVGRQAQQAKQLVAAVREENLEKLKLKDEEMWRMGKSNFFLEQQIKRLIQENQSLMNSVLTHQATITYLQAQLLERERLLEANVTAQEAESCCGNVDQVENANVVAIDQGGYDIRNDCFVINQSGYVAGNDGFNMDQDGYVAGDGGYNMDRGDFGVDDGGYIMDGNVFGGGVGGNDGYLPDKYKCKSCGEREASVLVLPCRHLCLCPVCETRMQSTCPVCEVKMESSFHLNSS